MEDVAGPTSIPFSESMLLGSRIAELEWRATELEAERTAKEMKMGHRMMHEQQVRAVRLANLRKQLEAHKVHTQKSAELNESFMSDLQRLSTKMEDSWKARKKFHDPLRDPTMQLNEFIRATLPDWKYEREQKRRELLSKMDAELRETEERRKYAKEAFVKESVLHEVYAKQKQAVLLSREQEKKEAMERELLRKKILLEGRDSEQVITESAKTVGKSWQQRKSAEIQHQSQMRQSEMNERYVASLREMYTPEYTNPMALPLDVGDESFDRTNDHDVKGFSQHRQVQSQANTMQYYGGPAERLTLHDADVLARPLFPAHSSIPELPQDIADFSRSATLEESSIMPENRRQSTGGYSPSLSHELSLDMSRWSTKSGQQRVTQNEISLLNTSKLPHVEAKLQEMRLDASQTSLYQTSITRPSSLDQSYTNPVLVQDPPIIQSSKTGSSNSESSRHSLSPKMFNLAPDVQAYPAGQQHHYPPTFPSETPQKVKPQSNTLAATFAYPDDSTEESSDTPTSTRSNQHSFSPQAESTPKTLSSHFGHSIEEREEPHMQSVLKMNKESSPSSSSSNEVAVSRPSMPQSLYASNVPTKPQPSVFGSMFAKLSADTTSEESGSGESHNTANETAASAASLGYSNLGFGGPVSGLFKRSEPQASSKMQSTLSHAPTQSLASALGKKSVAFEISASGDEEDEEDLPIAVKHPQTNPARASLSALIGKHSTPTTNPAFKIAAASSTQKADELDDSEFDF